MPLEPEYSKEAADMLDQIDQDPSRDALWRAICTALNLICDAPDSAEARVDEIRLFAAGIVYWGIPLRVQAEDQDWVIYWHRQDDLALIAYVGPKP